MKTEGYVIARNRKTNQFFTSTSSYDRPSWINVNEATVYLTPEMAHQAAIKLAKNGSYECRAVSLAEAIGFSLPPTMGVVGRPGKELEVDIQPDGEGGTEMVAADSSGDPEAQLDQDPDDNEDVNAIVDDELDADQTEELGGQYGDEVDGPDEFGNDEKMPNTDIRLSSGGNELSQRLSRGRGGLGESETMPAKPPLDLPGDGNKDTVLDAKKPEEIKYKDPANKQDQSPESKLDYSGAYPHADKVKIPSDVISELKASIKEFKDCAEQSNTRDDAKASFCMTVADAFSQLLDNIELGTVEGIKQAQIHMTSYMNPIVAHLPVSVQKFIYMGGRKPTLKDLFDTKRQQQKELNEAKNYMGDSEQNTYGGWKAACRRAYPGCTFRGDRDIGAAVLNGKDCGDWDGEKGSVYSKRSEK